MKTKSTIIAATAAFAAITLPLASAPEGKQANERPREGQAKVQLAILLDTSNSMDGLIDQAKTQLWRIVNTFIDAKQNGRTPFVEVALYEYGNDRLNSETQWIRRVQPLSRDLDKISEELFALRTNGGTECCGSVIVRATADLKWDPSPNVYKAIFIAGNEPFTQGPVAPSKACREAIAKGVIVNTIHCGDEATGVSTGWKDGAVLADGRFLIIDSNKAVVHISAPQDAEIVKLNEELNKTYLAYGSAGSDGVANQTVQDANAMKRAESGAAVQRAVAKASVNYNNERWDLVDARKAKDFEWKSIKEEDLPESLHDLSNDERDAKIAEMQKQRVELQTEIRQLNKEREAFVAQKLKESGESPEDTLDAAVTRTVRDQAAKKGYVFE